MSSFNIVDKIQYEKKQLDVVSLSEYILFANGKEKYAVLKLNNNVNQILEKIKIEVSQFDVNNHLLAKSVIEYEGKTLANEEFVPKAKLPLVLDCTRLEYNLLYAKFEHALWQDGEFSAIPFTIMDFKNIKAEEATPIKDKKVKKEKKLKTTKKIKKPTLIKDITSTNRKYKGKFAFGIILILMLALTAGGIYLFKGTCNEHFDGCFQYKVNNNKIVITDVDTSDKEVVIPAFIEEMEVVKIGENAFANTNVEIVKIEATNLSIEYGGFRNAKKLREIHQNPEGSLYVGPNAFENCINLEVVELINVDKIYDYTFKNCRSLRSLFLPNSTLFVNSLNGCRSLQSLLYNKTASELKFYDIFGNEQAEVPATLTEVSNYMDYISSDYFGEAKSITTLNLLNEECVLDFGALKGLSIEGYFANEAIEIFNGVVKINPYASEVVISNEINFEYLKDVFTAIKSNMPYLTEITIDYNNEVIPTSYLTGLKSLSRLNISANTSLQSKSFENCRSLNEINVFGSGEITVLSSITNGYAKDLYIDGSNLAIFDSGALAGLKKLTNIKISNVYYLADGLFNNLAYLNSLEMPFLGVSLNSLGVRKYIPNVYFNAAYTDIIPSYCIEGYNKLTSIEFPEGIKYVETFAISGASNLKELTFPNSIEGMNVSPIGSSCDNLRKIKTPFVGFNSKESVSYMEWNQSYYATRYLVITSSIYGGELLGNGLEDVIGISFMDKVQNLDFLYYCKNLKYLSLTNQDESLDLNNYYIDLDWLYLFDCKQIKIDAYNVKINNIYISAKTDVSLFDFASLENSKVIFYFEENCPVFHIATYYEYYSLEENSKDIDSLMNTYIK